MNYHEVASDLNQIPNRKTKDVNRYNRKLIKQKEDVSSLKPYVLQDQLVIEPIFKFH